MNAVKKAVQGTDGAAVVGRMPAPAAWIAVQRQSLLASSGKHGGHAWVLHGPSGLGQYALALELVRAWLCEAPAAGGHGACGKCPSCHGIAVRAHADLCVLMPEVDMLALGWPLPGKAQGEIDNRQRKPSREIRVDAVRAAVEFTQRTSARGRGKALLIYPAEQMNHISANALLKTLEEPPGETRFVLATGAAHALLPTIRSRCLGHAMHWPPAEQVQEWLAGQGVAPDAAQVFVRAAGGRPEDALALAQSGRSPQDWALLPRAVVRGDTAAFADFSAAQTVQVLQKLCHDLLALRVGGAPRYFARNELPTALPDIGRLTRWARQLGAHARTAEHPFSPGLMLDALLAQARQVVQGGQG